MIHLHIGTARPGSTTIQRFQAIQSLYPDWQHILIDTSRWLDEPAKVLRSIAYRFKTGPVIRQFNKQLLIELDKLPDHVDLVWVDKAVFTNKKSTDRLRRMTSNLWHYTPDPAFLYHGSSYFNENIGEYDLAITTKHFELDQYAQTLTRNKVVLCPQGVDLELYKVTTPFEQRESRLLFIGHYEKNRAELFIQLLNLDLPLTIAGKGWKKFCSRYKTHDVRYLGEGLFGDDYIDALNSHKYGLGLLSKWIPETHTTRTLEIPACGSVLFTEETPDTRSFFTEQQVVFFQTPEQIAEKFRLLESESNRAESIASAGRKRISAGGFSFKDILKPIIEDKLLQRKSA